MSPVDVQGNATTQNITGNLAQRSKLTSEEGDEEGTGDTPFVCPTTTVNGVEIKDVLLLKGLVKDAASARRSVTNSRSPHSGKQLVLRRCFQVLFHWSCPSCWTKCARFLELFIMDAFVDLFITLCIIVNTVFMAMDHAGMTEEMSRALVIGNYVFTTIFTTEAAFKILALGFCRYLKDKWNCFDIVIVLLSLIELGLASVKGLSILRSFRLLRVFKLAKSWPTLNLLIGIIGRTMGALGNLCFVLAIIVFIFAVMGMQLFGEKYSVANFGGEIPRWNFNDFLHSFMIVFRVLCGEWFESMWNCIHCAGIICIPFFLLTMIIGNLVVLNLFLALLLSSFGAESLQTSTEEASGELNKLQEAVDRITRFLIFIKSHLLVCFYVRLWKRPTTGDEVFNPTFAKVDFAGKIWFNSGLQPLNENGGVGGRIEVEKVEEEGRQVKVTRTENDRHDSSDDADSSQATDPGEDVRKEKGGQSKFKRKHLKGLPNSYVGYSPVQYAQESKEDDDANYVTIISPSKVELIISEAKEKSLMSLHSSTERSASPSCHLSVTGDDHTAATSGSACSIPQDLRKLSISKSHSGSDCSLLIDHQLGLNDGDTRERRTSSTGRCSFEDDESASLPPPGTLKSESGSGVGATTGLMDGPEVNEVNVVFIKYPDDCCPRCLNGSWTQRIRNSTAGRGFWKMRCAAFFLVEHKYFETFIIVMILSSSLSLAIEDVNIDKRRLLKIILKSLDRLFSVIFLLEMILKMTAYGFRKYFTDAWCWLDFIIVMISIVSLGAEGAGFGNMGAFRALRTLRALRPLRAVSRWEGMKVVVNALIQAIPAICNVLLVCLVFWLIFSIMGVNLFGGRFAGCVDPDGVLINASIVANETECLSLSALNYSWENPNINFDHVLVAYLALFQVATFKGWGDIMTHAIDSKEPGQQPDRETRVYMYLYFVFFIVFGSFFTLNLFIGVIIDNFNMQKKKAGGSMQLFMTEDQKKYYNAMKKLGSKRPQKPIPKPKLRCSLYIFKLTTNQKFDVGIMLVILLNMLTMALEHYDQPDELSFILGLVNQVFIAIFTVECFMKIVALRIHYFKQPWNVFDFVVVVMSILGLAMKQIIEKYFVSPTLLRVVRVFRVGRLLRLVKSAKGIRTLLFSLAVSLPALFNIGLLLFLIMFIYSIFGMSFFMHVRYNAGIEELFNFETFGRSMTLLFQVSTSAGWDGVLAGLMIEAPKCNDTFSEERPNGDCGSKGTATIFLVTYLVISFLVVINMYIAVILENFSQATEDVQLGLTQDDFDMYYEVWERYDEKATQFIPLAQVPEFVDSLELPLRLPAPNFYKLAAMDIPICEGDLVHCLDILDALTKNFLGTASDPVAVDLLVNLRNGPVKRIHEPVSSTLRRQRENYCARVIQNAWREWSKNKR